MVFEVENLNNASPATVSRCGIIYVSNTDLYWKPLLYTWAKDRISERAYSNSDEEKWMHEFTEKYIFKEDKVDMFTMLFRDYTYVMDCPHVVRITQFLNLMTAMTTSYQSSWDCDKGLFEKFFVYSLSWSCAGLFETEDREKFHKYLESRNAPLPQSNQNRSSVEKETIFDFQIDVKGKSWKIWEVEPWVPPKRIVFSQLLIPTGDSTRVEFIINKIANLPLIKSTIRKETGQQNTLLVGSPGTAKTSVIMMYMSKFDSDVML
jgi:dynein heavy chain